MSHFATPFIIVNLGCEMVYVIDQRLKAQNITADKSERVLTDIMTVLVHPKLLEELFIPQPVATHVAIKQLIQDISNTSIMKLDDYSMSKLWDLMTMIFKWQLFIATNQNIFDITRRHLKNVAILMPEYFPRSMIDQTMKRFEILAQKFTDDDYKSLSNTLILWFSEYHTKISVLMRLGLQKKDGVFNLPSTINPTILQNLGENIYIYDKKKCEVEDYGKHSSDTTEINCLLGTTSTLLDHKTKGAENVICLPIEFGNTVTKKTLTITRNITQFENIHTNFKVTNTDLTFIPAIPKSTQETLLDMLDDLKNS